MLVKGGRKSVSERSKVRNTSRDLSLRYPTSEEP